MAVLLHRRRYGADSGADSRPGTATPLLLVHGLFGSGANWHGIAPRLAEARPVLAADLRNHGDSPHAADMTYAALAADLVALLDAEGIERAAVAGHSLGGKAAMWLALAHPQRVAGLAVLDIAPVRYPHGFEGIVEALAALPLNELRDRRDADRHLAAAVPSPAVRGLLLKNLARDGAGWRWRPNLPALAANLPHLLDFPEADGQQFLGPTLFLYGTASRYVDAGALPAIRARFPLARLRAVPGAGHWLHADQPDAVVAALSAWLVSV